jgi:hypothetical protein
MQAPHMFQVQHNKWHARLPRLFSLEDFLTPYRKDTKGHLDVLRWGAGRHTDTGVKDVLDM